MRQSSTHRVNTPTRITQRHHSQPAPTIRSENNTNRIRMEPPNRLRMEQSNRLRMEHAQRMHNLHRNHIQATAHQQLRQGMGQDILANFMAFANAEDSYEARLRLDENNPKKGVGPEGLKRLHMHEFDSLNFENHSCPVCLQEYSESEFVANMPTCRHQFHTECIERWLQSSTKCPVCRTSMVK
jgi:hypothetical protein